MNSVWYGKYTYRNKHMATNLKILTEFDAKDWKIADLDPDTSGKYVFDYMEYLQDGTDYCENCGHPIKWCVHIHDAEDENKEFIVGDDCINFLLAISGGLENVHDLDKFRDAQKQLFRLFRWMSKRGIDTHAMSGVAGFVNKSGNGDIEFVQVTRNANGFYSALLTRDGRLYRPLVVGVPDFKMDDWMHFFPNLKKVLVSYDSPDILHGGYFLSGRSSEEFINFYRKEMDRIPSVYVNYYGTDEHFKEIECDSAFGKVKRANANGTVYTFLDDHTLLKSGWSVKVPNLGCLWADSLSPMFSECGLDMDAFLTMERNNRECMRFCTYPATDDILSGIEGAKKQQHEAEERKRKEEEEKARIEAGRKSIYDSLVSDSKPVIDGMRGHCLNDGWLGRIETPFKKIIGDKIAEVTKENPTVCEIKINNCNSTFILRFKDQIEQLKRMGDYSKESYLGNIVRKISFKYNRPTEWKSESGMASFSYSFRPTDIKDSPDGDSAVVAGMLVVRITPKDVPPASEPEAAPVEVSESDRIILTIGQLKRLVFLR